MVKKEKAPKPQYFTVKMEIQCPVSLQYKILAITPEEAIGKVEKNIVIGLTQAPKPYLARARKLSVKAYNHGMSNILSEKKY